MSIGKALILIGKALTTQNQNGHRNGQVTRYRVVQKPRQQGGQPPFHWHVTLFGRKKFVMQKIGYNQRTHKYVYQCPFGMGSCGGKAERPY